LATYGKANVQCMRLRRLPVAQQLAAAATHRLFCHLLGLLCSLLALLELTARQQLTSALRAAAAAALPVCLPSTADACWHNSYSIIIDVMQIH
jgi:hypothetical protein